MSNDWLSELEVGSQVIVSLCDENMLHTVKCLTETKIKLNGTKTKYQRQSGWSVAFDSRGSSLLIEPTKERLNIIKQKTLSRKLNRFSWGSMPLDILTDVNIIIESYINQKQVD
jgi:hypothetical protein